MPTPSGWSIPVRAGAGAIALVALAVYAWFTAATPYLLDSAELAATGFGLGIAHPPGEPLALLWTRMILLLPTGSVAFRAGLAQALANAMAVALQFCLTLHILTRFDRHRQIDVLARFLLAAAAACAFAFSPGAVQAATRPEVYALSTALALAALSLTARALVTGDVRLALLAAFVIGLHATNHPLLAAATGIGAVILALPFLRKPESGSGLGDAAVAPNATVAPGRLRLLILSVAALFAGLLVNLYIPLRSLVGHHQTDVTSASNILWGDGRTWRGLWWILSGETFLSKSPIVHGQADPGSLPFVFINELGVATLTLAAAGLYAAFRRSGVRLLATGIVVCAAGAIGAALFAGFDPRNPDIRGYLGMALACLPVLSALGCAFLLLLLKHRHAQRVLCATALVISLTRVMDAETINLRGLKVPERTTAQMLDELPIRAALLTGHFETAALLSYQRLVEGRRPDIAWAHLGFARGPGYVERISQVEPDLAGVLESFRHDPLDLVPVLALNTHRPVHIEPAADLTPTLAHRFTPCGSTWCLRDKPPLGGSQTPVALPAWRSDWAWQNDQTFRPVHQFLGWRLYLDADLACRTGRPEAATLVAELRSRLPQDAWAEKLAADCALGAGRGFNLLENRKPMGR